MAEPSTSSTGMVQVSVVFEEAIDIDEIVPVTLEGIRRHARP